MGSGLSTGFASSSIFSARSRRASALWGSPASSAGLTCCITARAAEGSRTASTQKADAHLGLGCVPLQAVRQSLGLDSKSDAKDSKGQSQHSGNDEPVFQGRLHVLMIEEQVLTS